MASALARAVSTGLVPARMGASPRLGLQLPFASSARALAAPLGAPARSPAGITATTRCSSASSSAEEHRSTQWQRGELRVFVHPSSPGGGNPVTTFLVPESGPYPDEWERAALAQTCSWESAFVQPPKAAAAHGASACGTMRFHVPSGPGMDMCAHAAIGASALLAGAEPGQRAGPERVEFRVADDGPALAADVEPVLSEDSSAEPSRWTAALALPASSYRESFAELSAGGGLVQTMLQTHLGLDPSDLLTGDASMPLVNSGVMGRTKTMVPLRSPERVNAARGPPDPEAFRLWCDAIGSTGVYLYAKIPPPSEPASLPVDQAEFECRQFPWASGYPEDPATGVAAMALALSLSHAASRCAASADGQRPPAPESPAFAFHQGRAMGMPSLIKVRPPPTGPAPDISSRLGGTAVEDGQALSSNSESSGMMVVCEGLVERV